MAISLLAWFVFGSQCMATLATVRRESGGGSVGHLMTAYVFAPGNAAAFITFRLSV